MTSSMSDQGDRNGFQQGWEDGMKRRPANPSPSLAFGLFDTDYLRSFRAAYNTPDWGIVGEIERIGGYHCRIRGADGSVIAEFENIKDECDDIPHVMPPEAFGLKRKPWWNDTYPWCAN